MSLLLLDVRTVIFLLWTGNLVFVTLLVSYRYGQAKKLSISLFGFARLLQAVGWMLMWQRGVIPDVYSVFLGNAGLFVGFALEGLAIMSIEERRPRRDIMYGAAALLAVIVDLILYNLRSPNIKIAIASLVAMSFFVPPSFSFLFGGRSSVLRRILGVFYMAFCVMSVARAVAALSSAGVFTLMTPNTAQSFAFLSLFLLLVFGVIGYMFLIGEKSNREQARIEDALRRKTALLEAQLNTSIDGILVVDENQKRLVTNRRIVDLWNVPKNILEDEDDTALLRYVVGLVRYPEEFFGKVMYLYDHPSETSRDEIEFKNGMVLDRYSAPVFGDDGQHYGRIWIFRDITERRQAEEILLRSETRYRTIVENVNDAIYIHDLEGTIIDVNDRACQMAGYERSELIGANLAMIDSPEDTQRTAARMRQLKADGSVVFEGSHRHKSGTVIPVEISAKLVTGEGKGIVQGFARDITERKRAEEERMKLAQSLRDAQTEVRTLSGLLPICSSCKRIRRDDGTWEQLEVYIRDRSRAEFTHSICPACTKKLYPDLFEK